MRANSLRTWPPRDFSETTSSVRTPNGLLFGELPGEAREFSIAAWLVNLQIQLSWTNFFLRQLVGCSTPVICLDVDEVAAQELLGQFAEPSSSQPIEPSEIQQSTRRSSKTIVYGFVCSCPPSGPSHETTDSVPAKMIDNRI